MYNGGSLLARRQRGVSWIEFLPVTPDVWREHDIH
jgi:hypothetical protein